jgi:hypothetical protein
MTTPNEDLILKLRGQAYTTCRPDQLCDQAADLLQSQAERISELEAEYLRALAAISQRNRERTDLRAQLADAELHTKQVERGLDKATAQLAEIAKTEPVTHQFQTVDGGWHPFLDDRHFQNTKDDGSWPIRALFTRPMPTQGVTELVEALSALVDCITETRGTHSDAALVKAHAALSKYKGAK